MRKLFGTISSRFLGARPSRRAVATAFVARHPAVIIVFTGPRAMEQLKASSEAGGIRLTTDILVRINDIVAPGVTVNTGGTMWMAGCDSLSAAQRRR